MIWNKTRNICIIYLQNIADISKKSFKNPKISTKCYDKMQNHSSLVFLETKQKVFDFELTL